MNVLSVCSGIEAASVAWNPLGWRAVAFSEIDTFPCAVLAHHYPETPNWGDLTKFKDWPDADVDVLVGGTPCQSFSVAGLRQGLADPRGNLALTYLAVLDRYRPRWCVWENVPGVLSADGGRAMGAFLGGLGQLGYGWAYRSLDAQYFGLAQRRERVFVVGYLGDWRRAAAVLLEPESLSGHPAPRRDAGQVAPTTASRRTAGGGLGTDFDCDGGLVACLDASYARLQGCSGQDANHGHSHLIPSTGNVSHCLNAGGMGRIDYESETLIAFDTTQITSKANRSHPKAGDPCHPLAAGAHAPAIAGMSVRRLTPRECERLQGFPDDYTLIPYRGKPAADGPRYKALGNSMAVPVIRWIGERLAQVDAL
jgi:DNA (cytosine-5)-methyltransferase 1